MNLEKWDEINSTWDSNTAFYWDESFLTDSFGKLTLATKLSYILGVGEQVTIGLIL